MSSEFYYCNFSKGNIPFRMKKKFSFFPDFLCEGYLLLTNNFYIRQSYQQFINNFLCRTDVCPIPIMQG